MRARYIKIGLWVVALVAVWNIGQSYTAMNALLLFAADGVVPGTSVVLQPDQVFWLLGAILLLTVLAVFATNIRRTLLFWFARRPAEIVAETTPVAPAAAPSPVATIVDKTPRKAKPDILEQFIRRCLLRARVVGGSAALYTTTRFPRAAARLHRGTRQALAAARKIAGSCRAALANLLITVANRIRPHRQKAQQQLRAVIIRGAIMALRTAIQLWRWAEPRLRRFDFWLGVQYHRAVRAIKRGEFYRDLAKYGREFGKSTLALRDQIRAFLTPPAEK